MTNLLIPELPERVSGMDGQILGQIKSAFRKDGSGSYSMSVCQEPPYPGTDTHHDAQIWKDGDTWQLSSIW